MSTMHYSMQYLVHSVFESLEVRGPAEFVQQHLGPRAFTPQHPEYVLRAAVSDAPGLDREPGHHGALAVIQAKHLQHLRRAL